MRRGHPRDVDDREGPPGFAILDDLRANLSRGDIARYLADFGSDGDAATQKLTSATGGQVDLRLEAHRVAVIGWLRSWGVRHLRRSDTAMTAAALRLWWDAWGDRLPGEQETLNGLGEAELAAAGQAYDALRAAPAAARTARFREIEVTFGDTATSKLMFAVRPRVFVPWDAQMRAAFGWPADGGPAYTRLLRLSAAALDGLARRLAVPVGDLPGFLGRPGSTPPKIVDEFLLIRIIAQRPARRPQPRR